MHIITRAVLDMETLRWVSVERHEYDGPWSLAKGEGAKNQALANAKAGAAENTSLVGTGEGLEGDVTPFLEGEVYNPLGIGQPAINAENTSAGQAVSGEVGNATQAAKLRAARSGNPGGEAAIIASAAKSGAGADVDAAREAQIENARAKLAQQQSGAQGLENLAESNIGEGINALGVSNQGVNAWANANKSAGNFWQNYVAPFTGGGFSSGPGGTSITI